MDQKEKTKIFVSAYACEPGLGSEIGVGWHWVLEMSRHFDLWVLTRESNRHTIEPWIARHPEYSHIRFLYYDLPRWARWWKRGMRGVRLYYNLWQWRTDPIVRRTMRDNGIAVYHLLTYGNALWPASSYGQKQVFVWGPIGGVDTIPADYTSHYGWKWRLIEAVRRMVVAVLPLNRGFQHRCRDASLILCKSHSMREAIKEEYRHKAVMMTDVAVETQHAQDYQRQRQPDDPTVRFLMVGRLDAWRGFDLAVEALAKALRENGQLRLDILGEGSDRKRITESIKRLGIGKKVTLHGKVPMDTCLQMMADSDVVLNPCLKEGAVTTAFDAMTLGKPLIGIDTGGYTRYFNQDYAILIAKDKREKVVERLAEAILRLADKRLREDMGHKAKEAALHFSWQTKGDEIAATLRQVIGQKNRPQSDNGLL